MLGCKCRARRALDYLKSSVRLRPRFDQAQTPEIRLRYLDTRVPEAQLDLVDIVILPSRTTRARKIRTRRTPHLFSQGARYSRVEDTRRGQQPCIGDLIAGDGGSRTIEAPAFK